MFVEEHKNSNNSPYKFNASHPTTGKPCFFQVRIETERNVLTKRRGTDYYGARYYDPKWSVWLSVDPMEEKHPDYSSYAYCANDPITLVGADGKDWIYFNEQGKELFRAKSKWYHFHWLSTTKQLQQAYPNHKELQSIPKSELNLRLKQYINVYNN